MNIEKNIQTVKDIGGQGPGLDLPRKSRTTSVGRRRPPYGPDARGGRSDDDWPGQKRRRHLRHRLDRRCRLNHRHHVPTGKFTTPLGTIRHVVLINPFSSGVVCRRRLFGHMKSRRRAWDLHAAAARPGNPAAGQGSRDRPTSVRRNSTCRPPTNAEGRMTQRFFSVLLKQTVSLGENAHHFCHVLGSPSAQRDNPVGQTASERGQRVVHARWHLLVVGPR